MRLLPVYVCALLVSQIFPSLPAAASETGNVAAYNVKQQNLSQVPPCSPALGDGASDDTGPIQCALNAAGAAGGGSVFLPQGTYRTSASLNVPSFVTLQGAGSGSIIKPLNGASIGSGVLLLSNGSSPVTLATVRDLHIDGNGHNLSGVVAGIALDNGASHNTVMNDVIENATGEGIGLYASSATLMNDYNLIASNFIHDNGAWTSCGQVIVSAGRYNQIVNNAIYKTGAPRTGLAWGILLLGSDTQHFVQHNIIRGNRVTNTGYAGIWATISCSGCTTEISWNEISGNVTNDNQNWGILLSPGAGHQTLTANTVSGNGLDGILIQSGGNTVSDNMVSDNSASGPWNDGIAIEGDSTVTDNVIVGNVSQNVTTTGQRHGVAEYGGGPDFNLISGNNGRNNALSPGVFKSGGHTVLANNVGQ